MDMDYKQTSSIKLNHCPCVMEPLDDHDSYVVGTYELDEKGASQVQSSYDNDRKGSLAIIRNSELVVEQDCIDGGVFDLEVYRTTVIAAHANGKLCFYKLNEATFEKIGSLDTGSNMLTTIDYLAMDNRLLVVAADATGHAYLLETNNELNLLEKQPSTKLSNGDPIWRVKLFRVSENVCLLISGSDDCKLRINRIQGLNIEKEPLCICKEATAGITSIELVLGEVPGEFEILCGSYDEKLRFYKVNLVCDDVKISLQKQIRIPDAGIWKTRSFEGFRLVIGMYAGIVIANSANDKTVCSLNKFDDSIDPDSKLQDLIYDAVVGTSLSRVLVASFYKKQVYVFEKI